LINNIFTRLKKETKRLQRVEHHSLKVWSPSDISIYYINLNYFIFTLFLGHAGLGLNQLG
jgi:hypothetical protein